LPAVDDPLKDLKQFGCAAVSKTRTEFNCAALLHRLKMFFANLHKQNEGTIKPCRERD
jgi:hypothetical protein